MLPRLVSRYSYSLLLYLHVLTNWHKVKKYIHETETIIANHNNSPFEVTLDLNNLDSSSSLPRSQNQPVSPRLQDTRGGENVIASVNGNVADSYPDVQTTMANAQVTRHTFLDELVKPPTTGLVAEAVSFTEATLLRFFVEHIAGWFDFCDPDSHFANVLSEKSRKPGPLRNALLAYSARHVLRYQQYKGFKEPFEWKGHYFEVLQVDTAVKYHNNCIQDLLQLSADPEHINDPDLLAAAVVLRCDEEIDIVSDYEDNGDDKMVFLKVTGRFIDAQVPQEVLLPHTSPVTYLPDPELGFSDLNGLDTNATGLKEGYEDSTMSNSNFDIGTVNSTMSLATGLTQACFWVALRQEIYASFLKQKTISFPLGRCGIFRSLAPATDHVWAVRMVTFCADVLEFCHGNESVDGVVEPATSDPDRWTMLKNREKTICALLPPSFEPTYCREPTANEIFPQIWYLRAHHANSTTYIELARMMLAVYDPARRRLGRGSAAAQKKFMMFIKKTVLRLCGIALSNRQLPPTMINAYLSIAAFGEYFDNEREREALMGVLYLILNEHAYPVHDIVRNLKKAWYG